MKMDSIWEEQLSQRLKIERSLNFATIPHEEDDFGYARKKTARDPMSHRIIEKRRRDRMNNCLADLSRLIPTAYLKKGRGRIEKTEIIEMAIKHLKHLQAHSCKDPNNCEVAKTVEQDRKYQYRLGFQECMSETLRFLVEIEGLYAGDGLCVRLVSHLQKHYEKIAGGMGFTQQTDFLGIQLAEESRDASMDVTCSPSHVPAMDSFPPTSSLERATTPCRSEPNDVLPTKIVIEPAREECPPSEGGSQLREMLQNPGLPKDMTRSSNYSISSEHQKSEEVYKFKNNIKHRFNADLRHHVDYQEDDKSYLDLRGYSPFPQGGVISPSSSRNGGTQRSFRPTNISISTSSTNELSVKVPDRTSESLHMNHWDSQADCGSSSCGSNASPPSVPRSSGSSSGYSTGGDITFAPRLRSQLQGRHSPGYPHTPPENNTNRSPSPQHGMKTGVPIFALHPKGAFYVPLTIDWAVVAQSFIGYEDTSPVLHPVSISVNFCRQVKLKMNGLTSWEQRPFASDKCSAYSDSKTSLTFACATVNP